jgi:lipooligosaccharide transport system permease protein
MQVLEPQARSTRFSIAGAGHVVEAKLMLFRRLWRLNVLSSFGQPLFYLLAMGVGVGSLVNQNSSSEELLGGVSYVAFIAPGLLATTAMVVATIESSWPVLAGFKWERSYLAMAATPLDAVDIVIGHMAWIALRVAISCTAVAVVMAIIPETRSTGLVLAVVFAILTAIAIGMPTAAYAATRQGDGGFAAFQRFVVTPLLLFGGAFFPISQLPSWMRPIVYITPLWHGVELCRGVSLHTLDVATAVGHIAYLGLWAVVGTVAAIVVFRRRLAT